LETARTIVIVALVADGLQIATALTTALLDPTKWRDFFTLSSIAAAFVVTVIVIATWSAVSGTKRALGLIFVAANVAFVLYYTQPGQADALPPAPPGGSTAVEVPTTTVPTNKPAASATVEKTTPPPQQPPVSTSAAPRTRTTSAPAPRPKHAWTVTPRTSRESTVDPGSGLQLRFWPYPSGNDVVGDLRYEGDHAWAPVGFGKDCTAPYATYIFSGIPAGRYSVAINIPDLDGELTTNAEYSGPSMSLSLDQSAHRGKWVELPTVSTSDVEGNAMIGITMNQRHDEFSGEQGCSTRGERIIFGPIRVTKVG
jgi:hypothetical protein